MKSWQRGNTRLAVCLAWWEACKKKKIILKRLELFCASQRRVIGEELRFYWTVSDEQVNKCWCCIVCWCGVSSFWRVWFHRVALWRGVDCEKKWKKNILRSGNGVCRFPTDFPLLYCLRLTSSLVRCLAYDETKVLFAPAVGLDCWSSDQQMLRGSGKRRCCGLVGCLPNQWTLFFLFLFNSFFFPFLKGIFSKLCASTLLRRKATEN